MSAPAVGLRPEHPVKTPRSIRAQQDRRAVLFETRAHRRLTAAEADELRKLDEAFYMREWRRERREQRAQHEGPPRQRFRGSPALAEVARVRREQVERFGHTFERDAARDLDDWARELRARAKGLHETLQFNRRDTARAQAIRLAALATALADRLIADAGEPT